MTKSQTQATVHSPHIEVSSSPLLVSAGLADFPGPVVFGFPSGHTTGAAMTLPFGVACRVIAGPRPRLVIEESAVS